MPPQQPDRLLDLVHNILDVGAHGPASQVANGFVFGVESVPI
jgi:hypothetical protein